METGEKRKDVTRVLILPVIYRKNESKEFYVWSYKLLCIHDLILWRSKGVSLGRIGFTRTSCEAMTFEFVAVIIRRYEEEDHGEAIKGRLSK